MDPAGLFASVADLLPAAPAHVADIGAGTGRDAAWFAVAGHRVTAVEPAAAMRDMGMQRHSGRAMDWIDDRLPSLARLRSRRTRFDLLTVIGVWHHLNVAERQQSLAALHVLTSDKGQLLLRVRQGPSPPERPGYELLIADTIEHAAKLGFRLVAERAVAALTPANRAAGVSWTWLALRRS